MVGLDDLSDDPQSQSQAAVLPGRHQSLESFEDAVPMFGRDSNSMVADRQAGPAIRNLGHHHLDRRALTVLDGIRNQIGDDLLDPKGIPKSPNRALCQ